MSSYRAGTFFVIKIIAAVTAVVLLVVIAFQLAAPRYRLWRASVEKRILVEEAVAQRDSAVRLAEAEVERAKGVAASNEIIAGSINPEYLRYLFITHGLNTDDKTVIYVPTEANLPILEASRERRP